MSVLSLHLPDDLKATIAAQAERAGASLDQYLLFIIAAHAGSQAETERYFAARAARSSPARGLEILSRVGNSNPPEPGDELPSDLANPTR